MALVVSQTCGVLRYAGRESDLRDLMLELDSSNRAELVKVSINTGSKLTISLAILAIISFVFFTSSCHFIESGENNTGVTMHPYYQQQKEKLTTDFSDLMELIDPLLRQHVDAATAQEISKDAHARYAVILEELPYIGGDDNWLTGNLINGAMAAAFYLPLKERGLSVDEAGRMFYEAVEQAMSEQLAKPAVRAHDAEAVQRIRDKERQFAAWTQKREYPYNWVAQYVDCAGTHYDYGRDWVECGIVKLHKRYGVEELSPYLCLMDCIVFRASGQGLHRTKTLAEGDDRCDFRINLSSREIHMEPFSERKLREWGKCGSGCCGGCSGCTQ